MPRMGNPSISKIMFAHIALLGFQRAGGLPRRFFVTTLTLHRFPAFASEERCFFSLTQEQAPYANEKAVFKNAQLSSLFEEKSMNHFEQRLADAFTPSEARQMFKLPRISVFASRQRDFFLIFFNFLVILRLPSPLLEMHQPLPIESFYAHLIIN